MSASPTAPVQRFGAAIRLREDKRAEYLALHAEVWPAVEARIRSSNIRNYTIFLREEFLFGYFEYIGKDYAADMAAMKADAVTRQWWALTDPCQERLPGTPDGEQWAELSEVWHLD